MGKYARKRERSEEASAAEMRRKKRCAAAPGNAASPANSEDSSCDFVNTSGSVLASCCSNSRSTEMAEESLELVDLKKNAVAVELFATASRSMDLRDRRENSLSSEVQTESGDLESTVAPPHASDSHSIPTAEKMPTEAELEEFFAAAEKNIQRKFMEKYNYDIVNDEPLEGRYEWVSVELKP